MEFLICDGFFGSHESYDLWSDHANPPDSVCATLGLPKNRHWHEKDSEIASDGLSTLSWLGAHLFGS